MWVGGTGMGFGSASSFWSAVGFFPISTPRVFTSLERPTRSGGTAASEAAWMLRARERSSSDEIPFSVRERVSSRICFWLARFFSALSSCIWSARTPMYARATSAMSVTRTSRWSSSVASYVASSASICRATRPKTSSSQLTSAPMDDTVRVSKPVKKSFWALVPPPMPMDGYRPAFAKPRRARASLTLETAILRSLLPSSARAMIEVSIGSSKTVHHSRMSASSELNAGSSIEGSSAAGSSTATSSTAVYSSRMTSSSSTGGS